MKDCILTVDPEKCNSSVLGSLEKQDKSDWVFSWGKLIRAAAAGRDFRRNLVRGGFGLPEAGFAVVGLASRQLVAKNPVRAKNTKIFHR